MLNLARAVIHNHDHNVMNEIGAVFRNFGKNVNSVMTKKARRLLALYCALVNINFEVGECAWKVMLE